MRSHLTRANIDVETEEGCVRLLKRINAEGGIIYYRSADNTNRLVISPSRKGEYRSLAGMGTTPSLAERLTEKLRIESVDDWLRIKKEYNL
jgi:hypothetical protein